jgi:hypothetical protein
VNAIRAYHPAMALRTYRDDRRESSTMHKMSLP